MFRLRTRTPDTRFLLRSEHRLQARRTSRSWFWVTIVMACLIGALLYLRVSEHRAYEQRIAALDTENQALRDALEQRRLQRQEAEATQEQLLGRIASLSEQIERLQADLAFYRQQKKAP